MPEITLITKEMVAAYLRIDEPEPAELELLTQLIAAATQKAETYTGRAFLQREITETHLGDGTKILKLYKQPVVEVDSVTLDGNELTVDTDYTEWLHIGRLHREALWTNQKLIVVVYTAGYDEDEVIVQTLIPQVVQAVLLIIANLYENRIDQLKSESTTGLGSVTYDIPSQAKELLNPYRIDVL